MTLLELLQKAEDTHITVISESDLGEVVCFQEDISEIKLADIAKYLDYEVDFIRTGWSFTGEKIMQDSIFSILFVVI